jgi:hypothetical protein
VRANVKNFGSERVATRKHIECAKSGAGSASEVVESKKRAAIDAALLADPDRTDADIAREVGCDPRGL